MEAIKANPNMVNVDGNGKVIVSGSVMLSTKPDYIADRVVTPENLPTFLRSEEFQQAYKYAGDWMRDRHGGGHQRGNFGRRGRSASVNAPGRGRSASQHRAASMTREQAESQVRDHARTFEMMGINPETATACTMMSHCMSGVLRHRLLDLYYSERRNSVVTKSGGVKSRKLMEMISATEDLAPEIANLQELEMRSVSYTHLTLPTKRIV